VTAYTNQAPDTVARPGESLPPALMRCRQTPDVFFVESAIGEYAARRICVLECTVRAACLEAVLASERGQPATSRHGIAAGLDGHGRLLAEQSSSRKRRSPAQDADTDVEPPTCGTPEALLLHLLGGEPVDPQCWSAEELRQSLYRRHQLAVRRAAALRGQAKALPAADAVEAA
jgi:hypothetical protein